MTSMRQIKRFNATTLLGVLVALASFSFIAMVFFQWQTQQSQQASQIYQQVQIQRIIDNQHQRQLLKLPCEQEVIYNQHRFSIQCSNDEVRVHVRIQ